MSAWQSWPVAPVSRERAQEIIAAGPPFDLVGTGVVRHQIFPGRHTVVFVFEGPGVEDL